jgi:hypothetical protein
MAWIRNWSKWPGQFPLFTLRVTQNFYIHWWAKPFYWFVWRDFYCGIDAHLGPIWIRIWRRERLRVILQAQALLDAPRGKAASQTP